MHIVIYSLFHSINSLSMRLHNNQSYLHLNLSGAKPDKNVHPFLALDDDQLPKFLISKNMLFLFYIHLQFFFKQLTKAYLLQFIYIKSFLICNK